MKVSRGRNGVERVARWHPASLMLNFATILCVTAAMAMAGNLESGITKAPEEEKVRTEG